MKIKNNSWLGALLLVGVLALRAEAAPQQQAGDWRFTIAPYGALLEMHGDSRIGNRKSEIDVGFDKLFDLLGNGDLFGGAFILEAAYRNTFRIYADTTGMYATPDLTGPAGGKHELDVRMLLFESAIGYRVLDIPIDAERHFGLEPLVGVRYIYSKDKIKLRTPGIAGPTQSFTGNVEFDMVEPLVGGRVTLDLLPWLDWSFRGDAGGFGVGSDLSWQILSVFLIETGWKPFENATLDVALGYRLLDFHKEDGIKETNMQMRGPLVGLLVRF